MISKKDIVKIQQIINYKFNNIDLLKKCFIHPSCFERLNKKKPTDNKISEYERLEFLGDRVLGIAIAHLIYKYFPNYSEGKMSIKFSYLVKKDFLYQIITELKLYKYITISKNSSKLKLNKSVLADTLEAIIGAIFIDGGFKNSNKFISNLWSKHIKNENLEVSDPKTILQELSQKKTRKLPIYNLIKKSGAPHLPTFTVSLSCLNIKNIIGKGSSIRSAEKDAAKKFLKVYKKKYEK